MAIVSVVAFGLATMSTYRPHHLAASADVVTIPYDSEHQGYLYNTYLDAVVECEPGYIEVWATRFYGGSVSGGSDVIGWQVSNSEIQEEMFEPALFGQSPMDDGAAVTKRHAMGAVCLQGEAAFWGFDNAPSDRSQAVIWSRSDASWIKTQSSFQTGAVMLAIEQASPDSSIYALSTESGAASSTVVCREAKSTDDPSRLIGDGRVPYFELDEEEAFVDATAMGSKVFVLTQLPVKGAARSHKLMIRSSRGCDAPSEPDELVRSNGSVVFDDSRESITVGPDGRLALVEMGGLTIREFVNERERRSFVLDLGFKPTGGGIYRIQHLDSGVVALAYAYKRQGGTPGTSSENRLVRFDWDAATTRCIRWLERCLPGDDLDGKDT